MAQYETEEQQVEAIKNFWKENGSAIILGAVIGFGSLFGWNYYQDYKQEQLEVASEQYAMAIGTIVADTNEQAAFSEKAEQLKTDFVDSNYSALAALRLAKFAVEEKKFEPAMEQLQWVVDQGNEPFKFVAQLRQARILLEQKEFAKAEALASNITHESFKASALLIKAEAQIAAGNVEEAKTTLLLAKNASENVTNPSLALRLAEYGLNEK